ncbi:nucleoside hydrolase [Levilactobacillus huananensis]|uniref:nucleoside hydrolase n=1 Tax=Levilactobacillus huananensis TaxID=2486019 RepID=UPI001CDC6967|nr:nucleoside hydrolase [Levilactobacillus huananensis]
MKKKLIIDTDCGSDDAMAIAMALNDPKYEIIMFSTVSGNVHVTQATQNTLSTIEHAGSYEPPVYVGADHMLLRNMVYAHETHGNDGMGDIGIVPTRLTAENENSVIKMVELLEASQDGEIDIIAIGPLTNIALAIRLNLDAVKKAGRIVVMGTAGLGRGNASPVAEFNIWQDPESAKIVTEAGLDNLIYVGWDASLGKSMLTPEDIKKIKSESTLGKFTIDVNKDLLEMNVKRFGGEYLDMADPSAIAAALYPDCIVDCDKYYCEVDTNKGPSYGAMLVDVNNVLGKEPNAYICSKLDPQLYKNYIFKTLA